MIDIFLNLSFLNFLYKVYSLLSSLEMHWKTMIVLFLFQCFCFIVVLGQRQGSKFALVEKVTSDPKRNIHCVIYFTDKSSSDLAITGLSAPAIIYHYRKNGYIILMFLTPQPYQSMVDLTQNLCSPLIST